MPIGIPKNGVNNKGWFVKGCVSWNKGKKRLPFSEETKRKMSESAKKRYKRLKNGFKKGQIGLLKGKKNPNGSIAKMGSKNPMWNPDRDAVMKNERNDGIYKQWVRKVKYRDGWKCRIFSQDCSGYLIVHHISGWAEYLELRYEINNGITLCQAHHPRRRAEEKRLSPYFQGLVSVSSK